MKSIPTASQTVGPFFSIGLEHLCQNASAGADSPKSKITIHGTIFDAEHSPIPDAVLEFWGMSTFVRVATSDNGTFSVSIAAPVESSSSAHLDVLIFMRGLLKPVYTRVYFGSPGAVTNDPVLKLIPSDRIATLFANPGARQTQFGWNVIMQGKNETVFFDY